MFSFPSCRIIHNRSHYDRLAVFSPQVPFDIHLQVKSRCDLALDTPLYNSHGTAADLLWAGVPLLSLPGEGMAARLASSILKAIGLPLLVAASLADYERVALLLFSQPILLQAVRTKIENSRASWVLHDYSLWARRFHVCHPYVPSPFSLHFSIL